MKNKSLFLLFSILLLLFVLPSASAQVLKNRQSNNIGQNMFANNGIPLYNRNLQSGLTSFQTSVVPDSLPNIYSRRNVRPWQAAAQVVGLDLGIHVFDRYIERADFAQITLDTIFYNLRHGFIWDNDGISTNMFFHPFTGALYFNAARSNGLNFWQSIPYTIGGSLIWECFGESEPPSLNDLIATPIGGIALGEITHRISFFALDERKRGWGRVGHELLGGIISPMGLLTRVINGDAWRVRPTAYRSYDSSYANSPFLLNVSVTSRFLTDVDKNRGSMNMALSGEMIYGHPFIDDDRSPFDFFTANIDMSIIGNQPFISEVNVIGLIWGNEWKKNDNHWLAGVFQHFDLYDTDPVVPGGKQPYEFAETAAFGGGLLYKHQKDEKSLPSFSGAAYVNLILLGSSESDYYMLDNRDYNIGNGYSVKLNGKLNFGKHLETTLGVKHYQIFTTHGYGSAEAEVHGFPEGANYHYANIQGNRGNALLSMINVGVGYQISSKLRISAEQRFFFRNSHYDFLPDVMSSSMENRIQLTYTILNR